MAVHSPLVRVILQANSESPNQATLSLESTDIRCMATAGKGETHCVPLNQASLNPSAPRLTPDTSLRPVHAKRLRGREPPE